MIKIKRIVFPLIHLIFFTMLLMAAGQDQNGKRTRPARSFLLLVCLVRGSGRERMADPGSQAARPRALNPIQ
jgi:hypothetical protein